MTTLAEADAGIRQLHARYTDAVWRKDAQAFADCFTEDGEWRISGMVLKGRAEIEATIARILANFEAVLISFRTPLLDVSQSRATGRTYIDERCAWKNGNRNISIGRYYEYFVEQGGIWRFEWRLFELHYRGPPDMTGTFFDHPDYGPPPAMPPRDAETPDMAKVRWGIGEPDKA
ncbi:MAG: nuclear transport factor 2 family protein [Sphingomonadales bacterium]|nr:nuclear transport factor 2 family protein [Sphingomonadales bacterium]